jgi:hypothetical protein
MPFPADSIAGLKRSILLGVITAPPHLSIPCRTLIRKYILTKNKCFFLERLKEGKHMNSEMSIFRLLVLTCNFQGVLADQKPKNTHQLPCENLKTLVLKYWVLSVHTTKITTKVYIQK